MSKTALHRLSLALRVVMFSATAGLFVLRYNVPPVIAVLASVGLAALIDWFVDVEPILSGDALRDAWQHRIRGALAQVRFKINVWPRHWELALWHRINGNTRHTAFGPCKLSLTWANPHDLAGFHGEQDEWESAHLVSGPIDGLRWSTLQVTLYRGLPGHTRGTAERWYRLNGRGLRVRNAWWRAIEVAVHAQ